MDSFPYQQEAIAWMTQREEDRVCRGGFLCHEMGLGKTHMMTTVIAKSPGRTVLFAPKSTMPNWCETLRKVSSFAFDVREFRSNLMLSEDRPVVVVATHQSLIRNLGWFTEQRFTRMVIDEAHVIREGKTALHRQSVALATIIPIRWGITATPFNNGDADIASYLRYLFPMQPLMPTDLFRDLMIRKTRADVFPGGPRLLVSKLIYDFEYDDEKRLYDYVSGRLDMMDRWIDANRGHLPAHVVGNMILLRMLRERQATIHPQIVLNAEKAWRPAAGIDDAVDEWDRGRVTKMNHIMKLVEDDQKKGDSTLIITHFGEELSILADRLTAARIPHKILNGKTKVPERRKIETHQTSMTEAYSGALLDQFTRQKKITALPEAAMRNILGFIHKPTVVLMQIAAGGVGLSMPWIRHVINTSPDWNPFLERQAIYRAYRLTSTRDVRVTQVYLRDTIDGKIHTKQHKKLERSLYWTGDAPESLTDFVAPEILINE
jgi:SNF2 family DNA or RNA helicase